MRNHKISALKIKVVSLADEGARIRFERARLQRRIEKAKARLKVSNVESMRLSRHDLYVHQRDVVGYESRHANLAYGFLRGRSYVSMENLRYSDPNWNKIEDMVRRFGGGTSQEIKQKFEEWKQSAPKIAKRLPRTRRENKPETHLLAV